MKRRVYLLTAVALVFSMFALATAVAATHKKGSEGCTPGYWKQSQHFDSWTAPYDPTDTFVSAGFEDAFPGKTLLQVLEQGGGGLNALGRHTVAALLSSASGIDYLFHTADVIAMFNAAFPGGDIEGTKNLFAAQNELGCPLN